MKVDMTYWEDEIGKTPKKITVEAGPCAIFVRSKAEWQMAVAAEDKKVEANKMVPIKIAPIELPRGAIALQCFFMRHALGVVASLASVGKPKSVEEARIITQALFNPIEDGIVYKDELLTIINIFPAAIGEELPDKEAVYKWMEQRYTE